MRAGGTAGDARAALGGSSPQPGQLGLRPAGSDGGGGGRRCCTAAGHQPCSATGPPPRPSPHGHHHLPGPAVSSLPLPPVAHPCALVTVPRAPSRASWGEGVTLITLGARAERRTERGSRSPHPPPPSSLFRQEGSERDLPRPIPPTPPPPPPPPHTPTARAPAAARAKESASHQPACDRGPPGARVRAAAHLPLPPPLPARALPRLTLRGSGRVKSGSRASERAGGPIGGAAAAAPSPPPVRPLRARAYGMALLPGRGLRQAPRGPRAPPGSVGACGRRGWH